MNQPNREEEESFYHEDRDQPIPPENVVAYNELRSCADLYRMHSSGKLEIQPDFQREIVWKPEEQTRFIDSLVKQLPIPSMCFSLDNQTKKWKVIDGLQRMHTITLFLGTAEWKMASVEDIHPLLKGKKNSDLRNGVEDEKKLYSSVEDLSVPITVIRCSYEQNSHMRYLFTIFNRLNSGGTRLNSQEIRNCIYSGKSNDLLKQFDKSNREWGHVRKKIWGKLDRFRSVEILLRAIAFSKSLDQYEGNFAGFLNDFMFNFSKFTNEELAKIEKDLSKMARITEGILKKLPAGKKSLTFMEGMMVGILTNINLLSDESEPENEWLTQKANSFTNLPAFGESAKYGLANPGLVKERLRQAIELFSH